MALGVILVMSLAACARKSYICPAYQSAFQIEMLAYKRDRTMDSLAFAADTGADVDVIAVLAERIYPEIEARRRQEQQLRASGADGEAPLDEEDKAQPEFPPNSVVKNEYLIIKRVSRKRKDKMMATVPMIAIFPVSPDTTKGAAGQEDTEMGIDRMAEPDADQDADSDRP